MLLMAWVLEAMNELLIHSSDYNGARATTEFFIDNTEVDPAGGAAAALANGVQGMSDDHVTANEILRHATWDAAVVPTDGPYARPSNKMDLTFNAADGSKTIMQVPGLNEVILDTDHITVNPAQAAAAAFIAYVQTNCKSSEGAALVGLARGIRRIPPRLKKQ